MADTPRTEEQLAQDTRCTTPEHLFGGSARELIWRSCRAFLDGSKLTPIELLHSSQHQRRFIDAGSSLSAAVQKLSIAQVAGRTQTVTDRMRELYALTDTVHKQTLAFEAAHPDLGEARHFGSYVADLDGEPAEKHFAAFAVITRRLAALPGWQEKFAAVLDLAEESVGGEALVYVDNMVAELLHSQPVAELVLGDLATVGPRLDRIIDLMDGTAKLSATAAPHASQLAQLMGTNPMAASRAALRSSMVRELSSDQSLVPGKGQASIPKELAALIKLRQRLERNGQFLGGGLTEAALQKRFARAVNESTITALVAGARTPAEEAKLLLPLYGEVLGSRAKDALRRSIEHMVKTPPTAERLLGAELSPPLRLKALVELHQAIGKAEMTEGAKIQMNNRVAELHAAVLEEFDPIGKIEKRSGSNTDKALAFLDLCRSGMLLPGEHLTKVRQIAQRHLKAPDFLSTYLADTTDEASKTQKLQQLKARLIEAGLAT
ncbi:MAG: hypothetical protein HYR63_22130 [Proteobacteria bacterium]|nr:hypothetical protein [Pseudomonadota bacterium]MBI3505768.1 hypothetical protein [Pseudomonadota bacterium]